MSKKKPKYMDPRDEYVRSLDPITVPALAEKWHREDRDGYSRSWLYKRSAGEHWRDERLRHWDRIRQITTDREIAKTADEHARIVTRYTGLLEGIMGGALRFLKQFEPPEDATPAERAAHIPDYKNAREAASTLMDAIQLDRKVRGLDVQKFLDLTDEEGDPDYYAHASDADLEQIIDEADEESVEGTN